MFIYKRIKISVQDPGTRYHWYTATLYVLQRECVFHRSSTGFVYVYSPPPPQTAKVLLLSDLVS